MHNIIIAGKYPEVELNQPAVLLEGYLSWKLVRNGQVIQQAGPYRNSILDVGLDEFATAGPQNIGQAKVGTDSTPPTTVQTGVIAPVGGFVTVDSSTALTWIAGPPIYMKKTLTFKWLEAQGNGNLTEIGIYFGSGAQPCYVRQLFRDSGGSPTVIVKTAVDQLFVTWEFRGYPPTGDVNSVVTISGVNYDVTARPCNKVSGGTWSNIMITGPGGGGGARGNSGESNVLQAETARPLVFNIFNTDATDLAQTAYVPGNYYVENKYVWDLTVANYATGIGLIALNPHGGGADDSGPYYQFCFVTTKIPKDNTKKLTMYIRKAWARYP